MAKKMAEKGDVEFKQAFVERYKQLLGKMYNGFIECSLTFLRKSVRVNTLNISENE